MAIDYNEGHTLTQILDFRSKIADICKPLIDRTPIGMVGFAEYRSNGEHFTLVHPTRVRDWFDMGFHHSLMDELSTLTQQAFTLLDGRANETEIRELFAM